MCNCGNKRQALSNSRPSFSHKDPDSFVAKTQSLISSAPAYFKFEYTGSRSLFIKSLAGGQIYKFSHSKPVWNVKAEDAKMILRFSQLRELVPDL